MHTEDFSQIIDREHLGVLKELDVVLPGAIVGGVVSATLGELMVRSLDDLRAVEVRKDLHDAASILRIGDSSSIVGLSDHILEGIKGNGLIVVQELHELILGNSQIGGRELIPDVPSKRSELSTLKDEGVEEAKSPQESTKNLRLLAVLEYVVSERLVGLDDVVLKSLGRLRGSLDGVLHNSDWEPVRGHRGEPDSEGRVVVPLNLFDQGVESRHEGGSQMAVLENDPLANLLSSLDCLDGLISLTLSKG